MKKNLLIFTFLLMSYNGFQYLEGAAAQAMPRSGMPDSLHISIAPICIAADILTKYMHDNFLMLLPKGIEKEISAQINSLESEIIAKSDEDYFKQYKKILWNQISKAWQYEKFFKLPIVQHTIKKLEEEYANTLPKDYILEFFKEYFEKIVHKLSPEFRNYLNQTLYISILKTILDDLNKLNNTMNIDFQGHAILYCARAMGLDKALGINLDL